MFLSDFYQCVETYPQDTAISDSQNNLTYTQLDTVSSLLADELMKRGVCSGDMVCYRGSRSIVGIVAILGIWKAKGVYLPIDENIPELRANLMIEQSRVKCMVWERGGAGRGDMPSVDLSDILQNGQAISCTAIRFKEDNQPDTLAYILFTSGSTGEPKGVLVEHRGTYNHLSAKKKLLHFNRESRLAYDANIGFVISIWQQLLPLMVGATVFIFPEKDKSHLSCYIQKLIEDKIGVLEVVPSFLSVLLRIMKSKKVKLEDLKYLVVTGEKFHVHLANECNAYFQNTKIINAYGQTEISDDVAHYELQKRTYNDSIPIGTPIPNIHIRILNDRWQPVADGEKGNIVISGVGVSRGYIHDQGKAENGFRFGLVERNVPSYITGDYGYKLGNLFFYCGRKDNLEKINGQRIEVAEIEKTLFKCSMVENAIVVVHKLSGNDLKELHAYIQPHSPNNDFDVRSVIDFLKERLPSYMVPSRFIVCDSLPVGINGKVDRIALQILNNQ